MTNNYTWAGPCDSCYDYNTRQWDTPELPENNDVNESITIPDPVSVAETDMDILPNMDDTSFTDDMSFSPNMVMPDMRGMAFPPGMMIPDMGGMTVNLNEPETLSNPIYTPGYLREHIGRWMQVEFLIGDSLTQRDGRLVKVGASYIVLQSAESGNMVIGDIYTIKFVTIFNNSDMSDIYR